MTALDEKVRATGLLAFKAVIDHAVEHGLPAPDSIELDDRFVRVRIIPPTAAAEWLETFDVTSISIDPVTRDRERVHVVGTLPGLLGKVKIEVRWSRPATGQPIHLHAVGA